MINASSDATSNKLSTPTSQITEIIIKETLTVHLVKQEGGMQPEFLVAVHMKTAITVIVKWLQ
jgi:hypothetical protein